MVNGECHNAWRAFDPKSAFSIESHIRPHWSQTGAVVFVTFRTKDSIPADVIHRWHREKLEWLRSKGISCDGDLETAVSSLLEKDRNAFHKHFRRAREIFLDTCHGRCLLRRTDLAKIVADSLLHFDGDRYNMGDFVVMPNHVHLLAVFFEEQQMRKQFDSWLHWTARQINLAICESGHFWQEEPFDHLVRSPEQYEYLRAYIANNPKKAGLKDGEYFYRRYQE